MISRQTWRFVAVGSTLIWIVLLFVVGALVNAGFGQAQGYQRDLGECRATIADQQQLLHSVNELAGELSQTIKQRNSDYMNAMSDLRRGLETIGETRHELTQNAYFEHHLFSERCD